jgi:hypothetical protein
VSGNTAWNLGGGILNAGTMTVVNSTISGNYAGVRSVVAEGGGGGIYNNYSAALALALLAQQKSPAVGPSCYVSEDDMQMLVDAKNNMPRGSAAAEHGLYANTPVGAYSANTLRRQLYGVGHNPYRSRWSMRD